jgi:hypothetical protein
VHPPTVAAAELLKGRASALERGVGLAEDGLRLFDREAPLVQGLSDDDTR